MTTLSQQAVAPLREAPAPSPLHTGSDEAHPDVGEDSEVPEPVLAANQIQGNIVPGFLKDFQTLMFLRITDPSACKAWLAQLTPSIATTEEVFAFNRLFKSIRRRRGHESHAVESTWINIAFSAYGLRTLNVPGVDVDAFTDEAFKEGMAARASGQNGLGDPSDPNAEGHPQNWAIGGPGDEADIVLIVASDDRDDLFEQVEALEDTIFAFRPAGLLVDSGVEVIFKQHGVNLPGTLSGHEHFGFLDGVSQPGIRGRVSPDPNEVLTPRQNPREPDNQGKPGQDLLWPGEFIFGYPEQDAGKEVEEPSDNASPAGLEWAENGSFLVFRRLRQDVSGFHTFLKQEADNLGLADPRLLGAKLVGRWPSGAPILRDELVENPQLGANDCANNDFEFFEPDSSIADPGDPPPDTIPAVAAGDSQCAVPAIFPASPGDQAAVVCPFAGHIRKAYPRDDITPAGAGEPTPDEQSDASERDTQTHRLLRRGIPFGPVSPSRPDAPLEDEVERGLLFLAYQTSIVQQFEFVTKNWVNNPDFSQGGVGHDPIIGQNDAAGENRVRRFTVTFKDGAGVDQTQELIAPQDWVIPTGGGYFFAPSIDALLELSTG